MLLKGIVRPFDERETFSCVPTAYWCQHGKKGVHKMPPPRDWHFLTDIVDELFNDWEQQYPSHAKAANTVATSACHPRNGETEEVPTEPLRLHIARTNNDRADFNRSSHLRLQPRGNDNEYRTCNMSKGDNHIRPTTKAKLRRAMALQERVTSLPAAAAQRVSPRRHNSTSVKLRELGASGGGHAACANEEYCEGFPNDKLVRHYLNFVEGSVYCETCWYSMCSNNPALQDQGCACK